VTRSNSDWYLVIIVAVLVAGCGVAAFWLSAYTTADPEWFKTIGTAGFGALLGLLVPKPAAVVVPPPSPPDPPLE
jgi:hypothetical protein